MSDTPIQSDPSRSQLELRTAYGPVFRTILNEGPRNATDNELERFTNTGFFYIKNHEIIVSYRLTTVRFFKQPLEIKQKASLSKSKYFNGYSAPQSTRANPTVSRDTRESFSWRYEPSIDPDPKPASEVPEEVKKWLRAEDFVWEETSNLPLFRPHMLAYWQACLTLARKLVRIFALALDLPESYFDNRTTYPGADGVLNYYPTPTPEESAADSVGVGAHTGLQLFTLLWQDDVGGLQVLTNEGRWIWVPPKEGTFVVNIGDFLMRLSNDLFKSTVHRAFNRPTIERWCQLRFALEQDDKKD
ncbi:Clavaminate synthase-like protein [Eremomyces bilateralis CBS 781.70]|uniref:Clavaminate synthase-like protein n=1 Tax=Eremomyces bilateralis CBS 781.70 TaxID=1392243 RepID=A0A6G1GBE2_9PEZI|nr:Clavaminate synthase-like protein [Eremomyces bilateralis CBS 781.70]KAF1815417.1 Clavaminate synthase-like protein [Eremomyces bilateralis CBS 781.70]